MTNRYAELRKATQIRNIFCSPEAIFGYRSAANHETIGALLADYDRLREALSAMVTAYEHEASIDNPALLQARAALAQEQGESDAYHHS